MSTSRPCGKQLAPSYATCIGRPHTVQPKTSDYCHARAICRICSVTNCVPSELQAPFRWLWRPLPRTSVLFCTASLYNSNVKRTLLQDAADNNQSNAFLHCKTYFSCSIKIAIAVQQFTLPRFYKSSAEMYLWRTFAHEDENVRGRRVCRELPKREKSSVTLK